MLTHTDSYSFLYNNSFHCFEFHPANALVGLPSCLTGSGTTLIARAIANETGSAIGFSFIYSASFASILFGKRCAQTLAF